MLRSATLICFAVQDVARKVAVLIRKLFAERQSRLPFFCECKLQTVLIGYKCFSLAPLQFWLLLVRGSRAITFRCILYALIAGLLPLVLAFYLTSFRWMSLTRS